MAFKLGMFDKSECHKFNFLPNADKMASLVVIICHKKLALSL